MKLITYTKTARMPRDMTAETFGTYMKALADSFKAIEGGELVQWSMKTSVEEPHCILTVFCRKTTSSEARGDTID